MFAPAFSIGVDVRIPVAAGALSPHAIGVVEHEAQAPESSSSLQYQRIMWRRLLIAVTLQMNIPL